MGKRVWDGKAVLVMPESTTPNRPIGMAISRETAGQLANLLRKNNDGLGNLFNPLPDGLNEVLNALDYVLVGDPASVAAHRRMEAGKGMEPSGG